MNTSEPSPNPNMNPPLRILVVDDNEKVLDSLSLSLKGRGFDPLGAENGDKAWSMIDNDPPDLALIDVMLGAENGLDLLKRIQDREHPVPVLIYTGYGTVEIAIEAIGLGAFNYLQKPVKMDQLVPMIHAAVRLNHLERENRELQTRMEDCEKRCGGCP